MQNNHQKSSLSIDDWYELIAKKSKTSVENVKNVLLKYGIEPQSTTPTRKAIRFRKLIFSGTKSGTQSDGDFDFVWDGLDTGLYGILSEDNLVGKSSILNLFYGALRGDFSKVSPAVMSWVNELEVHFSIGVLEIKLIVVRDGNDLYATFIRDEVVEYSGPISGLAGVVDQFFMKELDFERMISTKGSDTLVAHGWPSMASALFVSGSGGAIIGDLKFGGLPQRLLQMFIGLPWISTGSRASAVYKIEKSKDSLNSQKLGVTRLEDVLTRLQTELMSLPNTIVSEEKLKASRIRTSEINFEMDQFILARRNIVSELETIRVDKLQLKNEYTIARRLVQSIKDDMNAGFIFRKLQPVCCPSCESTSFKEIQIEADIAGTCLLCKDTELPDVEGDDTRLRELDEDVKSLEKEISRLENNEKVKHLEQKGIETATSKVEEELEEIIGNGSPDSLIAESSYRRMALEATIGELETLQKVDNDVDESRIVELKILDSTILETKKMYKEKEVGLFENASELLKAIASSLGVKHLSKVTWSSSSLKIDIANVTTTYSKLSDGEKLRFRIAASITIAKLAALTGQGRHPGILFFDSPKAEEITESDFQEIISAITKIAEEDNALQIFIASRIDPNFSSSGVFKDTKQAFGKDFIF